MSEAATSKPSLTTWIMLAVLAWGALLALGSYLFGGTHPVLRAAMVFGVTVVFLGLWALALAMRKRRLERDSDEI
jgi:cation transporter-like permease